MQFNSTAAQRKNKTTDFASASIWFFQKIRYDFFLLEYHQKERKKEKYDFVKHVHKFTFTFATLPILSAHLRAFVIRLSRLNDELLTTQGICIENFETMIDAHDILREKNFNKCA